MSCTPKQIDLQAFFVTTVALLCQLLLLTSQCKLAAAQYKGHYYLVPPQSILTKQI